jgi:hypothetical protein
VIAKKAHRLEGGFAAHERTQECKRRQRKRARVEDTLRDSYNIERERERERSSRESRKFERVQSSRPRTSSAELTNAITKRVEGPQEPHPTITSRENRHTSEQSVPTQLASERGERRGEVCTHELNQCSGRVYSHRVFD